MAELPLLNIDKHIVRNYQSCVFRPINVLKIGTFAVKASRFLFSLIKKRGRGKLVTCLIKSDSLLLFY